MGWLSSLMLLVATSSCGDLTLVKDIKSFADGVKKEFSHGDFTLAYYLKNNCADCDTCIINLKQVYNIDFDKYYLVSEFQYPALTRSTPVSISVTGCSTWIRVFISIK